MNREALERPFDRSLIKTRKGPFGNQLSYIPAEEVVRRLLDAFDGEWSFEIIQHDIRDGEAVVLGRLTAGQVTKMAFGGSSITMSRDGEVISIADDLKAAATDALKKAASLFGVALHIYGSDARAESNPPSPRTNGNGNGRNHNGQKQGATGTSSGGNGNNGPNGNRLTQKQLSAIWGMGRSLGLSADAIRERTTQVFGVMPEHLSKTDASAFITELGEGLGQQATSNGG